MNERLSALLVVGLVWLLFCSSAEPPCFAQERESHQWSHAMRSRRLSDSADDAQFLEGTLSLLAAAEANPTNGISTFELLLRIAQRLWRAPPREMGEEFWNRLQAELTYGPQDQHAKYRLDLVAYRKQFAEPSPYDWRAHEKHWKELTQRLLQRPTDATWWSDQIAAADEHSPLFRRAYAAAAISTGGKLDTGLVLPLLEAKGKAPISDVQRLAEVLRILALAKQPDDDPVRLDLWGRLQPLLAAKLTREELQALARLGQTGGEDQRKLRSALVSDPALFNRFAKEAKLTEIERRQAFLAKEVKAAYKTVALCDVLAELQAAVSLPLWIDPATSADKTPITLEVTGTWLSVLEQVLAQTEHHFEALDRDLYWLGPPASRGEARAVWERSVAHAASAEGRTAARFHQQTALALEGLGVYEAYDDPVNLKPGPIRFRSGEMAKRLRAADYQALPLQLSLELLAEASKQAWTPAASSMRPTPWAVAEASKQEPAPTGGAVMFGPPHILDAIRQFESDRVRRGVELSNRPGRAAQSLADPTTLEFIETPLQDVCAYLGDLHGLPVVVAQGVSSQRVCTMSLKDVELGWALDLMLLFSGLSWSSDGEAVFLGSKPEIEEFQKRALARDRKRLAYPRDLAAKLARPMHVDLPGVTLRDAAAKFSRGIELPVALATDDPDMRVKLSLYHTPADVALDLFCLQLQLEWEVGENGVLIKQLAKP